MRLSGGRPALRSAMPSWISIAQRTASTTLRNSTRIPSPVRLTTRPPCTPIVGSMRSPRSALKPRERALLVRAREPAVADDVGDEDRRKFSALHQISAPGGRNLSHLSPEPAQSSVGRVGRSRVEASPGPASDLAAERGAILPYRNRGGRACLD